jgi:hypothetical protein
MDGICCIYESRVPKAGMGKWTCCFFIAKSNVQLGPFCFTSVMIRVNPWLKRLMLSTTPGGPHCACNLL